MDGDVTSQPSQDGTTRGRGKNKRFWTPLEDDVFIQALYELAIDLKWKSEDGFKSGYMNRLKEMIHSKLPHCGLKPEPHIESRLKHWSEKYNALAEMLGMSGFRWDDQKKLLQVEKSVYDEWVKNHKKAKGLYGVPFPHFDILTEIYGKDRVTGEASETFADAIKNMEVEMANEPLIVDSDDDDVGDTNSRNRLVTQTMKKAKKQKTPERGEKRKMEDSVDLVSTFQSISKNFGSIFEDMNVHLATTANAWSCVEEREQKMDDKNNNVLKEVMKLDGISPFEALEVATILIAEEHKLRVFYQAPSNLRKQYVLDLLKKI